MLGTSPAVLLMETGRTLEILRPSKVHAEQTINVPQIGRASVFPAFQLIKQG